jgi:hypothetical protein
MPSWPDGGNSAAAAHRGGAPNRPASPRPGGIAAHRSGGRSPWAAPSCRPPSVRDRGSPAPRSCALPPGSPGSAPRARPRRAAASNASATSGRTAACGRSSIRRRRTGNTGSPASVRTAPRPTADRLCVCFKISSPATSRVGDGGRLIARCAHARKAPVEKPPIDLTRLPHQRMAEVDDVLQRRPQQVPLPVVSWLCYLRPHADDPPPVAMIRSIRRNQNRQKPRPKRYFPANWIIAAPRVALPGQPLSRSSRTTR